LDYSSRPDYHQEDYELAIEMFKRAVSLDPDFSLAYAELAIVHSAMYHFHYDATEDRAQQALMAASRALELEPNLAEAHLAHGCYHYWCHRDYDAALGALTIAEGGRPSDARILLIRSAIRTRQGRFQEGLANIKSAFDLDPKSSRLANGIGYTLGKLRRYAEADQWFDRAIALRPDQAKAYVEKAANYVRWRGDTRAAQATLESAPRQSHQEVTLIGFALRFYERDWQAALDELAAAPDEPFWVGTAFLPKKLLAAMVHQGRGDSEHARGAYDSARTSLEKELEEYSSKESYIRSSLGIAYAGLERKEEAIREGKRGLEMGSALRDVIQQNQRIEDLAFIYVLVGEYASALDQIEHLLSVPSDFSVPLLRLDPRWDPLRDHQRYKELLQRYSLEPLPEPGGQER
jgi:serine/threonine-protein kinase